MDRFVHRKNVEHFQEMLKTMTDPADRENIRKLLAEEEAALRKAEEEYKDKGTARELLSRWIHLPPPPAIA